MYSPGKALLFSSALTNPDRDIERRVRVRDGIYVVNSDARSRARPITDCARGMIGNNARCIADQQAGLANGTVTRHHTFYRLRCLASHASKMSVYSGRFESDRRRRTERIAIGGRRLAKRNRERSSQVAAEAQRSMEDGSMRLHNRYVLADGRCSDFEISNRLGRGFRRSILP